MKTYLTVILLIFSLAFSHAKIISIDLTLKSPILSISFSSISQEPTCCKKNKVKQTKRKKVKKHLNQIRVRFIHDYLVKKDVKIFKRKFQSLNGNYNLGDPSKTYRNAKLMSLASK